MVRTPAEALNAAIPLRLRLKNPPAVFLGRSRESAWLREAIARASVTLVYGIGGLGKTSLVLATLRDAFPERVAQTVMIGLSPSDAEPELAVARAVAEASGASIDGLATEPSALLAQLLDLADASGFWYVLEDAHHGDPERVRSLLRTAAVYARASRWIVTSRVDPAVPELLGQTLGLGAMSHADLSELAHACASSLDGAQLERAVQAAAGSPWRLRQALIDPSRRVEDIDVLQGLSRTSARFLLDLSLLETAHPVEVLATFAEVPAVAELRALQGRGLLEPGLDAIRVHDVARGLLSPAAPVARNLEIAHALGQSSDLAAVLEAARLYVEAGQPASAVARLGEHIDALVEHGYAGRVFHVLEKTTGAEGDAIKLRCATVFGGASALASAAALPRPEAFEDRLRWVECLLVTTAFDRSAREARALREDARAAGNGRVACGAALIESHALSGCGDVDGALSVLDEVEASGPDELALLEHRRLAGFAQSGRFPQALEIAERLGRCYDGLTPATQHQVELGRLKIFWSSGRALQALEVVERLRAKQHGGTSLWVSLEVQAKVLFLTIERGRLSEAGDLAQRLSRLVKGAEQSRMFIRWCELRLALVGGVFADLDEHLEEARASAARLNHSRMVQWLGALELLVATVRNAKPPSPGEVSPHGDGLMETYYAAYERLWAARAGAGSDAEAIDVASLPDIVDLRIVDFLAKGTRALASAKPERALVPTRMAMDLSAENGLAIWEADARLVLCDVLAMLGRAPELAAELETLQRNASELGSPRYEAEAAVAHATFGGPMPDFGALERLATKGDVAPSAARRARALLDPTRSDGDAVDRVVVAALMSAGRAATNGSSGAAGEFRPGWGLDHTDRTAWLPDGRRIDFSRNDLWWTFLTVLERRGGAATKEDLAREVWGVARYHSVRDDKRMHVAVRRIRTSLEDVPSDPRRLVTTDDGYAFGTAEPVRRAGPPSDSK